MDNSDLLSQQDELARRRARLDDEYKYGQKLRTSPESNILDMLAGAVRGHKLKAAETQYSADAATQRNDYSERLNAGMNQYLDGMNGKPQGEFSPDGYGPQTPTEAPNPRKAVSQALLSQLPELQSLGKQAMTSLGKASDEKFGHTPTVMKDPRTGKNVSILTGDRGTTRPISDYEPVTAEFGPIGEMGRDSQNKPIMGQKNLKSGEIRWLPAGQTINIDNVGNKEALGAAGKVMEGARNGILNSQKVFASSERAYQLASDPQVITGFAASAGTGLANLGAKLGFGGAEAAAKTQALMAEMAGRALEAGQQMKGSFSDSDIKFLEKASTGNIEFTAEAIKRAASLGMVAAHNSLLDSNSQLSSARNVPGAEAISQLYPTPQISHKLPFDTDPRFVPDNRTGKVSYRDLSTSLPTPDRRKTKSGAISFEQFMSGGQ